MSICAIYFSMIYRLISSRQTAEFSKWNTHKKLWKIVGKAASLTVYLFAYACNVNALYKLYHQCIETSHFIFPKYLISCLLMTDALSACIQDCNRHPGEGWDSVWCGETCAIKIVREGSKQTNLQC